MAFHRWPYLVKMGISSCDLLEDIPFLSLYYTGL